MTSKAASRVADVPAAVLAELNAGRLETATLAEMLALDLGALASAVCPDAPVAVEAGAGITRRMAQAAAGIHAVWGAAAYERLAAHASDTARGWAAYVVALQPGLSFTERLARIRPLADDAHFGVREWAWLALRPVLAEHLPEALERLRPWTAEPSANVRRFAIEITRPRGVWCSHLAALKQDPEPARPLLDAVRGDDSRYVQNSAANWLNDAAKTRPDWVAAVVCGWRAAPHGAATAYICKRGLRSIP